MTAGAPPVLAVVKDLFFVARIRETARLTGVPLTFARTAEEVAAGLAGAPRFVLLDLTTGFDYDTILDRAAEAGVPVLAFTTHALAQRTRPWHARCARVVTKETLTAELPRLLQTEGWPGGAGPSRATIGEPGGRREPPSLEVAP